MRRAPLASTCAGVASNARLAHGCSRSSGRSARPCFADRREIDQQKPRVVTAADAGERVRRDRTIEHVQRGAGHRGLVRGDNRHARRLLPAIGREQHADERAVDHARPQRRASLVRLLRSRQRKPVREAARRRGERNRGHRATDLFGQHAQRHRIEPAAAVRFGHRGAEPAEIGQALPQRAIEHGASRRRPARAPISAMQRASALRNSIRIAC